MLPDCTSRKFKGEFPLCDGHWFYLCKAHHGQSLRVMRSYSVWQLVPNVLHFKKQHVKQIAVAINLIIEDRRNGLVVTRDSMQGPHIPVRHGEAVEAG